MHRIAAIPGGWNPQGEGVIFIEQTPAPIAFLTAADTDIQTLSVAASQLPPDFPGLRVANLLHLQQQLTIDTYAEEVLEPAKAIVLRLLGGRAYWTYGLEVVKETVERTGAALIVLPGDDRPDPDLIGHSTISLAAVDRLWRYFTEGGVENFVNALKSIADTSLGQAYNPPPPKVVPRVGVYEWRERERGNTENNLCPMPHAPCPMPPEKVGILFYRAHYLAGNTRVIDALCQALAERQLQPVPVFVSSLREPDVQAELLEYFQPPEEEGIGLLLNTTSFSVAKLETETPQVDLWQQIDVPVLQVILSSGTKEQWQSQFQGLSPRDLAMNVALPEVDGRIISRAVSFKAVQTWNSQLETDVVVYEPVSDRIAFIADLAANWMKLQQTPPEERRIALILANYPNRDGRLANGVGLDTPASCIEILKALQQAGYRVEDIPQTGDELIWRLTAGVTNDPEGLALRPVKQELSLEQYQQYFSALPSSVVQQIGDRWGECFAGGGDGERGRWGDSLCASSFSVPGIQLGNIFVGIQPARGYDLDPSLNYHAPDLEPTHAYLAFYHWVRSHFGAQAIAHIGKHGNLEWLPGKSVALSDSCFPEVALGPLPHFYPFIVNDPGEGSQAKRRSQAVIIDHLTPPMTRAELYGSLQHLESLIDEYYEAQSLDPTRLPVISDRIAQLVARENLDGDLGGEGESGESEESGEGGELLTERSKLGSALSIANIDGYLCELKEAQIRDGLHILGQCPQGRQLRDLIVAIARHPGQNRLGLTRALAQDWNLDFDPLTADLSAVVEDTAIDLKDCRTIGDMVEAIERSAAELVEQLIENSQHKFAQENICVHLCSSVVKNSKIGIATQRELNWISDRLLPALQQTNQEIVNLLRGFDGRYIDSGAAGAPTRGRPEVLPTGRNFYSVDIRSIPTETAWILGKKAAESLIERYTQEHGEYPQTLGLSVWGTSTMRTGGDDLAEALALLGVQPVWDRPSRRVIDFEILPLSILGRPRVDVTLRISGFFRDAFPHQIDLFDRAVAAVARLDEPAAQNPLADRVRQETEFWQTAGLTKPQAELRSHHRIFGSKPGAYGAGLQGLIESQNWTDDRDLARAYINWSCYAYTSGGEGERGRGREIISNNLSAISAPEAFEKRLQQMQIVLHNQDNREHDLLDSDDYYQFQGGLTVAVRTLTGKNPQTYFGDNSIPENPKIRLLKEEIDRVYRSRVVNPKWIAGVMRHGYKGAFEMAATVDYLFAYDATANCVEDFMYRGIAEAYIFNADVQAFIQAKNPWALRDMAERLLEAHQRGLWQKVDRDTIDKLRAIAHQAEGAIEGL
ncbi:MAG: cobaltochelatase subunit CobN [Cyanosarcina radialis HA8281-LM2]|nr:cobaltochelatase subunit CobN [Cyanosarcina radialis HA8281-LM2]